MIDYLARLILLFSMLSLSAQAEEKAINLQIADPYIELHTGPANSYPIFHVVDRGEFISLLKRKTTWFKVKTKKGLLGWASKQQMQQTLLPSGQRLIFKDVSQESFRQRQWEVGVTTGKLADAPVISPYMAYAFNDKLSAEFTLSQSIANVSSSTIYKLNLLSQPFPEWQYSPFFSLGFGAIQVKPKTTLVEPIDKNNSLAQIGLGFKKHMTRRFVLRFEMNQYVIFSSSTDKDKNEDISEWKLGFAIFF